MKDGDAKLIASFTSEGCKQTSRDRTSHTLIYSEPNERVVMGTNGHVFLTRFDGVQPDDETLDGLVLESASGKKMPLGGVLPIYRARRKLHEFGPGMFNFDPHYMGMIGMVATHVQKELDATLRANRLKPGVLSTEWAWSPIVSEHLSLAPLYCTFKAQDFYPVWWVFCIMPLRLSGVPIPGERAAKIARMKK